jgi:glyoxalase family protein
MGDMPYFLAIKSLIFIRSLQNFSLPQKKPTYGSLDICLVVEESIDVVQRDIEEKGYPIVLGPVARHGARGDMESIYLRDPDGNLVELCHYNL